MRLISFLIPLLLLSGCGTIRHDIPAAQRKMIRDDIKKRVNWYKLYPTKSTTPLIQRVMDTPAPVMKYLRDMDQRPDYTIYQPTPQELQRLSNVLENLPPLNRKVLQKDLLAIHFINNFMGSGMADSFYDEKGTKKPVIFLNPVVLKDDINTRLEFRENSAYIPDIPAIQVRIDCGHTYSGLMYVLTHETTHVVDYVLRINPYVEDMILDYDLLQGLKIPRSTPFSAEYWLAPTKPRNWDYPLRKKLHYYGLGGGPQIKLSEVEGLYRSLMKSPCASLYGTTSWAEDLADMVTFYHLTQVLKQPYTITVSSNGVRLIEYKPMLNPLVKKRFKNIRVFYKN